MWVCPLSHCRHFFECWYISRHPENETNLPRYSVAQLLLLPSTPCQIPSVQLLQVPIPLPTGVASWNWWLNQPQLVRKDYMFQDFCIFSHHHGMKPFHLVKAFLLSRQWSRTRVIAMWTRDAKPQTRHKGKKHSRILHYITLHYVFING